MKPRLILVSLGLALLSLYAIGTSAQEQAKTAQEKDDIITSEQQLLRQFADFQDLLLRLKLKLARGTPEERRRSEVLGKVLDECRNLAINQEFTKIIEMMRKSKLEKTSDLDDLHRQSDKIATDLSKILDMLRNSSVDRLSEERLALEKFIKDLQKNIDKQQDARGLTDLNKTNPKELAKIQDGVGKETSKIAQDIKKFLDKDAKGQGGEAKPSKGENKDAGKGEGAKGEAKDAGKQGEGSKGESKDGGKESQGAKGESKSGEPKAGGDKSGEPKAGSKSGDKGAEGAKPGSKGDQSGAKGKEGSSKENQKADDKGKEGGVKDAGGKGDPKGDGQQGAAKGDDKKSGETGKQGAPDSAAKPGQPGGDKQAGAKDPKGGDKAGGDAKADGDPKGGKADAKQGEAKSGESKAGQGDAKAGGEPGMPGEPKPGGQGQAKDGGAPPKGGPPPGGSKQDDDIAKAGKKIEEAGYPQSDAAKKIGEKDNKGASDDQGKAIEKLEDAKKKLEKLLRQLREEEIERVLAALEARCTKMLAMQIQVLAGTIDTDLAIKKNADKKADRLNKIAALKLADNEKDIVQEVNKCIDILESEGSAVAFPEVFQQLRQDMIHVQKRLEGHDVHDLTQNIEKDIITTLKEMIDALKKAQEDNKSGDSKPGKAGKSGKPGDQKLLELIQELKMVRALQKRVNDRTVDYAKRFPNQEQTADPQIVRELRILAERQQRIQQIVERIAKGDNK